MPKMICYNFKGDLTTVFKQYANDPVPKWAEHIRPFVAEIWESMDDVVHLIKCH